MIILRVCLVIFWDRKEETFFDETVRTEAVDAAGGERCLPTLPDQRRVRLRGPLPILHAGRPRLKLGLIG